MILSVLLALGLAPADTTAPPPTPEWAEPAAVIVHRQPAVPVVSIRLSLAADDPSGYAGAGHLIQHLHDRALRNRMRAAGGRLQYERNPDALVYTVTGPAQEVPALTDALLSVLDAPSPTATAWLVAQRELRNERLAEWETAPAHVRTRMRHMLFPTGTPAAGTRSSAARIEDTDVADLWAAMYDPARISVVAVGDVDPQAIRSAFQRLPAARPGRLTAVDDAVDTSPLADPQATRGWLGAGFPIGDATPASVGVTARLLRDRLSREIPEGEVDVEHWWTHQGQAMAVVVAVPGPRMDAARGVLNDILGDLHEGLAPDAVREAALALRREMLFSSRTPDRMAALLGAFADRTGRAGAADRFYDDLRMTRDDDVAATLREMIESDPVRIDLSPQPLDRP